MTALDNLTARQYVDARARWFSLPYVQGGTLGLKGSAAAVSPFQTAHYNETTEATDSSEGRRAGAQREATPIPRPPPRPLPS